MQRNATGKLLYWQSSFNSVFWKWFQVGNIWKILGTQKAIQRLRHWERIYGWFLVPNKFHAPEFWCCFEMKPKIPVSVAMVTQSRPPGDIPIENRRDARPVWKFFADKRYLRDRLRGLEANTQKMKKESRNIKDRRKRTKEGRKKYEKKTEKKEIIIVNKRKNKK